LSTYIQVANKESVGFAQNFIKSTPLPTIIQEVSTLLIKYPNLNSFYFNDSQALFNDINIGFALDDGKNGLKVATIFNTDRLTLNSIEESIADLSLKYTSQHLTVQELSSATFTITDLFNTGIVSFHPLVNTNNSAILGISTFRNGEFIIDLSFDHRLTSGKEVSEFLGDLKFRLETRFHKENNKDGFAAAEVVQCAKCLRDSNDDMNGQIYFHKAINSKFNGYICSNCLNAW
jgi:pyruvate/2-oxoglutarate dehydrogenase complex dihydrolipoamide acyltransferase (E2) component